MPQKRQNLASFISVGRRRRRRSDYGTIRILRLPEQHPGARTVADREPVRQRPRRSSDQLLAFTPDATPRRVYGNLLTLPVGDGLLYVQPLYTLRKSGEGALPAAAVRAGLLRRGRRHRHDAERRPRRRARHDDRDRTPAPARGTGSGGTEPAGRRLRATSARCCSRPTPSSRPPQQALKAGDLAGLRQGAATRRGPWCSSARRGRQVRERAASTSPSPSTRPGRLVVRLEAALDVRLVVRVAPRRRLTQRLGRRFGVCRRPSRKVGLTDAGWSSSVARWAHNPEVAGSNPAPATIADLGLSPRSAHFGVIPSLVRTEMRTASVLAGRACVPRISAATCSRPARPCRECTWRRSAA